MREVVQVFAGVHPVPGCEGYVYSYNSASSSLVIARRGPEGEGREVGSWQGDRYHLCLYLTAFIDGVLAAKESAG